MLRKTGLSLAIASALTLSGCFGGSSDDDPAPASTASVSGTASKGIIVNGLVSAYLFNANGTRSTTAIATATTNAEGDYTLAIPSQYSGRPLFIEITNNDGDATMRCDLAGGCGDGVAFGEDYDLDDNGFSLSAVIPTSSGSVTTNLTPLTTVAALKAVDAIAEIGNNIAAATAIANANSSVANTLNAMLGTTTISDITEVEVIDLTDADEVADSLEDSIALRIATINAAIVSATQDDGEFTIEQAIEEFTEYMAENPLTFDSEVEGDTDIVDILNQADAVWNETVTAMIEELDLEEGDDLLEELIGEGSLNDLIEDAIDDAVANEDETADDDPSETAPDEELDQAKAFVEELRELRVVGSEGEESTIMVDGQELNAILDNFKIQSEAADTASSEHVKQSFEALGRAVSAMATAYENNFDMETGETELTLPTNVVVDGISVRISMVNQSPTLRVDGEVTVEGYEVATDVDVTATVASFTVVDDGTEHEDETTWGDEGTVTAEIDLNIVGSAETGTVTVGFGEGSHVSGSINGSYEGEGTYLGNSGSSEDFTDATLTNYNLELNATIEQTVSANEDGPMSFSGGIELSVSSLRLIEESTDEWSCTQQSCSGSEESDTTITASVVGLALRGTFDNESESFDAAFSITGNATGVTFRELYSSEWSNEGYSDNSSSTGETPTNFVEVEASLDFDARLAGVADAVAFNLDVERTGYNDLDAQIRLAYPGRVIEIDANVDNINTPLMTATFTLSNNDGVTISVVRTADELSGTIEVDGVLYGSLDEGANGLARIVYTDGTFVSLF